MADTLYHRGPDGRGFHFDADNRIVQLGEDPADVPDGHGLHRGDLVHDRSVQRADPGGTGRPRGRLRLIGRRAHDRYR